LFFPWISLREVAVTCWFSSPFSNLKLLPTFAYIGLQSFNLRLQMKSLWEHLFAWFALV